MESVDSLRHSEAPRDGPRSAACPPLAVEGVDSPDRVHSELRVPLRGLTHPFHRLDLWYPLKSAEDEAHI